MKGFELLNGIFLSFEGLTFFFFSRNWGKLDNTNSNNLSIKKDMILI
jgi:hypothetical protein